MTALEAPPSWPANPFDREAQDITRTALPCLDGLIAAIRTRLSPLKLGRFNAGTFGTPRLHDANQSRSCLFTSFHAVSPFVCAASHGFKPMGQGIPDDGKLTAQSRNSTAGYGNGPR